MFSIVINESAYIWPNTSNMKDDAIEDNIWKTTRP